jgi:hypothetical protein
MGKMDTNTRLSGLQQIWIFFVNLGTKMILGTPDCLLSFANPSGLVDCAFHPCVRYIFISQRMILKLTIVGEQLTTLDPKQKPIFHPS